MGHSLLHSWMSSKGISTLHCTGPHSSPLVQYLLYVLGTACTCRRMCGTDCTCTFSVWWIWWMLDAGCWIDGRTVDGQWIARRSMLGGGRHYKVKCPWYSSWLTAGLTPGRDSWFDSCSSSCQTRIYNKPVQLCMYDSLRLRLHNQHQQASGVPGRIPCCRGLKSDSASCFCHFCHRCRQRVTFT